MKKPKELWFPYRIIIEGFAYLIILAIGFVDFHTDHEIFLSFFYLIPILMIAILSDRNRVKLTLVSLFASGTWLAVDLTRGFDYNHPAIPYWNALGRFMIFIIVAFLYSIQEDQKVELLEKNIHLQEADKLKNEFLGMAAHDMRSPLSIIKLYADSGIQNTDSVIEPLKESPESENFITLSRTRKSLEVISRCAGFMLDLLSDLLDITRIESGKVSPDLILEDYNLFIEEIVKIYRPKASNLNQELLFIGGIISKKVAFDRNMLCQVIYNLIDNAMKYSPLHSTITIESEEMENYLETRITDQGQGIPEEKLPALFDAFNKSSIKPSRGERSTGLGLSIVKRIVESHGGKVWVRSRPGEGSTFGFTLPLNRPT